MLAAKKGLSDEQGTLFPISLLAEPPFAANVASSSPGILPDRIISLVISLALVTNGATAAAGLVGDFKPFGPARFEIEAVR